MSGKRSPLSIILLTHQRELDRKTNTGGLTLETCAGIVRQVVWARREPDAVLVELLQDNRAVLVYPGGDGPEAQLCDFEHVILLDATWQEARKMYNQSPYLHSAPKMVLAPDKVSSYRLRRNQPDGGLCTAECVIHILRDKGLALEATELEASFSAFNQHHSV